MRVLCWCCAGVVGVVRCLACLACLARVVPCFVRAVRQRSDAHTCVVRQLSGTCCAAVIRRVFAVAHTCVVRQLTCAVRQLSDVDTCVVCVVGTRVSCVSCASYQTGLADVHVEISFGNAYYPCDFAFTYECGMGAGALGDQSKLRVYGRGLVVQHGHNCQQSCGR